MGDENASESDLSFILYGFSFLAIGVLCRQWVVARGISLPVHVFMIIAGAFIGLAGVIIAKEIDPMHMRHINPETMFNIYMCILMFHTSFNMEVHLLRVITYHMFVIGLPTIVMTYLSICLAGYFIFPYNLVPADYIAVASIIMTPGPHMMRAYLAPTNVQQDLKTLLEAEATFGNYVAFIMFKIAISKQSYQSGVAFFILDVLVSISVGFLVGKLTIFWISKIFKDYVNQTTIVLAFVYGGFALSYMMGSCGYMTVVTTGLVMSHRRASMSTTFIQLFNSILELFVFFMTSITCVSAGIYLMTLVLANMALIDLVTTLAIFVIQNLVRGLVLFAALQYASSHLHTKTNSAIIWACNIRGSYSIVMAFILLRSSENIKVNKPFILVMLQIMLSFVANSYLCSFIIGYLNEDTLSKKMWMIERAARLMIAIRRTTIIGLRNNVNIADADWNLVVKQTRLKSDFMRAYRYASWINKQTDNKVGNKNVDPLLEMKEEAIRQINLSEKASYSRLFDQGILSRESVNKLMRLITDCLKTKRLVEPKDVFVGEDSASFRNRLEHELIYMIKKGPQALCFRITVFIVGFLDVFVMLYAIFFEVFDHTYSEKKIIITCHNLAMFLGFCILVVFLIIKHKTFKSQSIWHSLYRIVIVFTFIDLMVTSYEMTIDQLSAEDKAVNEAIMKIGTRHYQKILIIANIMCILTRLLRPVTLIHVSPMLQVKLLNMVIHMQDKKLFIRCNMATGYIRVLTETLKKIDSIITDRLLNWEMKYICYKNKLEIAQNVGLASLQHPNVIAAVKTKTALRLTLNSMEDTLLEITEMGLLGEIDASIIHKEISAKIISLQHFPYMINAIPARAVLQNISWVEDDMDLLRELETRGTYIKFYTNDVIVTQGYVPGGIFVVTHGIVRVESVRRLEEDATSVAEKNKFTYFCKEYERREDQIQGRLELHGFCTRGNIIGELSFLNEKPEHKSYRCATYVETFFISSMDLADICQRAADINGPLTPIEMRMWRTVGIRQAIPMIHKGISRTNLSRLAIYNRMADSYIVDGNANRTLTVSPTEVSAVVLIQGYVSHYYSELRYVGPCILPYNQQKYVSHPEFGSRVIYLIIKTTSTGEDTTFENLVPEEPHNPNYEDTLTISSGSSDIEPYRREREELIALDDETNINERIPASGGSLSQLKKIQDYKVRKRSSIAMRVAPIAVFDKLQQQLVPRMSIAPTGNGTSQS